MIEFKWKKIDTKNNNTPIIKDNEIDMLAEKILYDYKPSMLNEPMKIKYQHFLESYLGAHLEFQHIYYEKDEGRIFGATSFNTEKLKIFNKEKYIVDEITLKKNTIVLDNYVIKDGKEGLELFTGLHEGGHLWLHKGVYTRLENQVSMFQDEKILKPVVCCRKNNIKSFGKKYTKKSSDYWREYQANYFASAIAMPKSTVTPFIKEKIQNFGITDGYVIEDRGTEEYLISTKVLPEILSDTYGVSKSAAYVRLKKLGFIVDKKLIDEKKKQFKLF